jgi:RND superfamily putative drug exporter
MSVRAGETIVRLRVFLAAGWVVLAVLLFLFAPGLSTLPGANVNFLIPKHTRAVKIEERSLQLFRVPLFSEIAVVQRDPEGLPATVEQATVRRAAELDGGRLAGFPSRSFAFPLSNSTTAITYLFFPRHVPAARQNRLATRYAGLATAGGVKALPTGVIPGQLEQASAVEDALPWIELATLLAIALILGIYFRSVVAPLVTLATAGVAYVVALRAVSFYTAHIGSSLPHEIEPLVIVLLLGVVTDYSVFFMTGLRDRLEEGEALPAAAVKTTQGFLPIIFTAGLLVAGGIATLRFANLGFLQALGPAMAISVIVGMAVSITFVPALMALLGRHLFWPGHHLTGHRARVAQRGLLRFVFSRRRALLVVLALVVLLGAAATGLVDTRLGLNPISALTDQPAKKAAKAASQGFPAGIISPTELIVQAKPAELTEGRLARFGRLLEDEPHVARVIGPGISRLADRFRIFRTAGGSAVRFLVVLDRTPFGAQAISALRRIESDAPGLLDRAGLRHVNTGFTGATAIAQATVDDIDHDLKYVLLAAMLVNLVLLIVFLRSLVAPLYLVASSALAVAATFGLTTYVFEDILGYPSLTYFVPIAVAVLLVSFGSDYNVFIVGRIYQESADKPLNEAIVATVPRASRAVTVAGLALAASFAMLVIIQVSTFWQFAFALVVGILIDTFIVRSLLIPAVMSLVGERSWWPGRRARGA